MTVLSAAPAGAATAIAPVSVALVGHGYWGRNLARNLNAADNLSLVAVADPAEEARAAAARAYPRAKVSADVADILADPDVEAVVLATAAGSHAELAIAALEAGKHVLVEKPLATTVEDGERMVAVADRVGLVLMVGHTFLHSPPVHRLRDVHHRWPAGRHQVPLLATPEPRARSVGTATPCGTSGRTTCRSCSTCWATARSRCRPAASRSSVRASTTSSSAACSSSPVWAGTSTSAGSTRARRA